MHMLRLYCPKSEAYLEPGTCRQSLWEASRRYSGEYYDEREGGRRAWHEASSDSDSAPFHPRSLTSLKNTVVRNLVAEMESGEDEVPGSQPKYSLMHSSGLAPGGHASVMHQVSPYISHIAQVAAEEASARKQQRILDSVAAGKKKNERGWLLGGRSYSPPGQLYP
eukprot:gene29158-32381_t